MASQTAAIEDSHVFTYPRGWFMVARADEVLADKPLALKFFGRKLVAFRTADGSPAVLDGTCPHMGAALAVGGTVDGMGVRCPFHNWRFGPDGRCNEIPYTKVIPPKARVNAYPARELNGNVFMWHDPEFGEPITRIGFTLQQVMGVPVEKWGQGSMQTSKPVSEILI